MPNNRKTRHYTHYNLERNADYPVTLIHATDNGVLFTNVDRRIEIPAINVQVLHETLGTYFEISDGETYSIEVSQDVHRKSVWECGYHVCVVHPDEMGFPNHIHAEPETNARLLHLLLLFGEASFGEGYVLRTAKGAEEWDGWVMSNELEHAHDMFFDMKMCDYTTERYGEEAA